MCPVLSKWENSYVIYKLFISTIIILKLEIEITNNLGKFIFIKKNYNLNKVYSYQTTNVEITI